MAKEYKNLLFDLGGVIMNLDRMKCVNALTNLGMKGANEFLGQYVQTGPFLKLEEGELTPDEFRAEMRKYFTVEVTDEELDAAFNQFLVGIPMKRLEELRELKKTHKIYLLSNTNEIMFDSKIKQCFRQEGKEINDYFDGIITSYEAKCAKPGEEIFHYTTKTLGITAEETLFFDDSQLNLDTADRLGFGTYLVKPGTEFIEYFEK